MHGVKADEGIVLNPALETRRRRQMGNELYTRHVYAQRHELVADVEDLRPQPPTDGLKPASLWCSVECTPCYCLLADE